MLASFVDTFEIQDAKATADGYMAFDARFARAGIYQYRGTELGDTTAGSGIVNVYRPESAVFDAASMAGWAHKPITDDHPAQNVTAANWKDVARGWSGDEVKRDGEFVRVPMMLADAGIIAKYKAGKVELSAGYRAEVTRQDGVAPSGEAYQFVMSDIRANHIAVVDKGRAGTQCRLGDAWPTTAQDSNVQPKDRTMNTKIILVDGLQVETTDAGAAAIEKLLGVIAAKDATIGEHVATIAARDAAISTKDGEIVALKAQVADAGLTPEKLDAAVVERASVIDTAKKVLGAEFTGKGMTDAAIRKQAVAKQLGDAAASMNDDAISGAFGVLASSKVDAKDGIQLVVDNGVKDGGASLTDAKTRRDAAHKAYVDGLNCAAKTA